MKGIMSKSYPFLALVLVLSLMALTACGEDETAKQGLPGAQGVGGIKPPSGGAGKKQSTAVAEAQKVEVGANWEQLRPYFLGTETRPGFVGAAESRVPGSPMAFLATDVFSSKLTKFHPPETKAKTVVQSTKPGNAKAATAKARTDEDRTIDSILAGIMAPVDKKKKGADASLSQEPPTPLTLHPLHSYVFSIIMTGVSDPIAVVKMPGGKTAWVHRNDRIGSEGAYVEDILTQKVLLRVPDSTELLEVSLAPTSIGDFIEN